MNIRVDGHQARKRFGQNFLADTSVVARIVESIQPHRHDTLLEIGPGLGALTHALLERVEYLTAIELDRDLAARLRTETRIQNRLTLIEANALHVDYQNLAPGTKWRIVGNLPYNISTPLLFVLLNHAADIQDMYFMLQKEVVERMTATPGSKTYGRLSIMVQYRCQVDALFDVPPESFLPPPKVMSAVVRLQPRPWSLRCDNDDILDRLVARLFNQRRKTLRTILRGTMTDEHWQQLDIDPSARPETLPIDSLILLSNHLALRNVMP